MVKKINLVLVLSLILFSFSLVAAENIGTFKIDEEMQITNYCSSADCTYMNLSSYTYPNGTLVYLNKEMTKNGQEFNYSFIPRTLGEYNFKTCANPNGEQNCDSDFFDITPNGNNFDVGQGILYGFVFLLIGMFLFFSITGMSKSESGGWLIGYICLTYILIYALMGILYLITGDFLWATPIIANILYIVWFIMGVGFLPFVIILSLYILGQEAKASLEQDYMKQGYTRDEAKELSKKSKR